VMSEFLRMHKEAEDKEGHEKLQNDLLEHLCLMIISSDFQRCYELCCDRLSLNLNQKFVFEFKFKCSYFHLQF
jgi:hypothetical protein